MGRNGEFLCLKYETEEQTRTLYKESETCCKRDGTSTEPLRGGDQHGARLTSPGDGAKMGSEFPIRSCMSACTWRMREVYRLTSLRASLYTIVANGAQERRISEEIQYRVCLRIQVGPPGRVERSRSAFRSCLCSLLSPTFRYRECHNI